MFYCFAGKFQASHFILMALGHLREPACAVIHARMSALAVNFFFWH